MLLFFRKLRINTSKVIDAILTSGRIEQQSYRSCMGLLKLAEKYSPEKLKQVCAKTLSYSGKPSYKSIKNLLATTKDAPDTESESSQAVVYSVTSGGFRNYPYHSTFAYISFAAKSAFLHLPYGEAAPAVFLPPRREASLGGTQNDHKLITKISAMSISKDASKKAFQKIGY